MTMQEDPMHPPITLGSGECHRLVALAHAVSGHQGDDPEFLRFVLGRARTVPDDELSREIVRMNSTVKYRTDDGWERTVTLVYPQQADAAAGMTSILSTMGAALIGLRLGQTITLMGWDGAFREVTVLSVDAPR
jgi:regulator of nucleoside diphosphate kinase